MPVNRPIKMPRSLRYRPDAERAGFFKVEDSTGTVWAEGVPNEAAARVFAASPGLLLGYDAMLEDVFSYFAMRWDIGFNGPDLEDFVEDEGELEDRYPGAPGYACWLQALRERSRAVRLSEWESPIEPYVEPQLDLF